MRRRRYGMAAGAPSNRMSLTQTAKAARLPLALAKHSDFVCRDVDALFVAIKRCLDNQVGTCFVVDEHHHLIGRVTLDSAGKAIRAGERGTHTSLGQAGALAAEPADPPARTAPH